MTDRAWAEEVLAPAPAPTVALNAADEPFAVVIDPDERSLTAVAVAEVLLEKRDG